MLVSPGAGFKTGRADTLLQNLQADFETDFKTILNRVLTLYGKIKH